MKKNTVTKLRAYFLILIILFNTISPTLTYGLASSTVQPEFASYESNNSKDMVNLITGNFGYNIPILYIPSPEGGISLPLSYHAGIETDEESSWVGLGWNINPGVINRSVSQYPDDYSGRSNNINVTNSGGTAYVKNWLFYTEYYNNSLCTGGSIAYGDVLKIGWGSDHGTEIMGVTIKDGNATLDVGALGSAISDVAMLYFSGGLDGAAKQASNEASFVFQVVETAGAVITADHVSGPITMNNWTIKPEKPHWFRDWALLTERESYWLDVSKSEKMYGALYLGKPYVNGEMRGGTQDEVNVNAYGGYYNYNGGNVSTNNYGSFAGNGYAGTPYVASDALYNHDNESDPQYTISPSKVAYDNYAVSGEGISGAISPYRHEVGTLFVSSIFDDINCRRRSIAEYMDYKVSFLYKNELSNSYSNHIGQGGTLSSPTFGLSMSKGSDGQYSLAVNDNSIYIPNLPSYDVTKRVEQDRNGLKSNTLVHGKYIEWYSNSEIMNVNSQIISGTTSLTRTFMDYLPATQSNTFRTNKPGDGIGGFAITREDGLTYHYALPVYNNSSYEEFHQSGTNYSISNNNPYAYNWLLTGITGADFVDRGQIGVIDDQDWGYWVKYNYGLFSPKYNWRFPFKQSLPTNQAIFNGQKENYYLNTISTRSHTAIFVKSLKKDGKSSYNYSSGNYSPAASASLKLDDIIVIQNEDYGALTSNTANGYNVSISTGGWNSLVKADDFNTVFDGDDFQSSNPNSAVQTFISNVQLKKIHFNYSYDLCKGTLNSYDFDASNNPPAEDVNTINSTGKDGKLTLLSVDIYGRNNTKTLPSFMFDYGNISDATNNPNYDINKWDGWGVYNSNGNTSMGSHFPDISSVGDQWSLKKITTPLGGEIDVTYERDSYSNVNGNSATISITSPHYDGVSYAPNFAVVNSVNDATYSQLVPGNTYWLIAKTIVGQAFVQYSGKVQFLSLNSSTVFGSSNIDCVLKPLDADPQNALSASPGNQNTCTIYSMPGYVINGGDLRVKEISVSDEDNNKYKTKYIYTLDGTANGLSSGVASFEPEICRSSSYDFYKNFDTPVTPVLYSKVTTLSGVFNGVFDFTSKVEYNFSTPNQNLLSVIGTQVSADTWSENGGDGVCNIIFTQCDYFNSYNRLFNYNIQDRTSQIGSITNIKTYNHLNQLINKTDYNYTTAPYSSNSNVNSAMGTYSEGSLTGMTFVRTSNSMGGITNNTTHDYYHNFYRTTRVQYPYYVSSVSTTQNGITKVLTNSDVDYFSGIVTSTNESSPTGGIFKKIILAYQKYPSMGSKVMDPSYKNMMSLETANYNYVGGGLVSADVKTWKNNWDYIGYDNGTNTITKTNSTGIWHPYQSYSWKSLTTSDGNVIGFNSNKDFNWGQTNQSSEWQKNSEKLTYNYYSRVLESKDVNGKISSSKYGYNFGFFASNPLASYNSWTCSGAEDMMPGTSISEGDVSVTSRYSGISHTGNYSAIASSVNPAFYYIKQIGTDFIPGKTYRASVWIYSVNAPSAELSCLILPPSLSGGGQTFVTNISSPSTKQAGNWYQLNLEIPLAFSTPSNYNILVSVANTTTNSNIKVYADDFKFWPEENIFSSNVYDNKTGLLLATLDKNNWATKYSYDNVGRIIKIEVETASGFQKTKTWTYNFGRP